MLFSPFVIPRSRLLSGCMVAALLLTSFVNGVSTGAQVKERTRQFPETGYTVKGRFLDYWEKNGGLAQQGFPISEEMQEISDADGNVYLVQYFERVVLEYHPKNQPPYDVLLTLLGAQRYLEYYGPDGASNQRASTDNPHFFRETERTVGGAFRRYWEQHGGLAQQGYPISDEFQETSALNGKTYTVQYFQRAVFEFHPENAGTPFEVLLTQLGAYSHRAHHGTLVLPDPIAPDLTRRNELASDRYFVWSDVRVTGAGWLNTPPTITPIVTRALDLTTQQVITVTANPSDEAYSAISGSIVVGLRKSTNPKCSSCDRDVIGKDLSTGATFTFATGKGDRSSPQVAGRTVAWVEQDEQTVRIVTMNIDTRAIVVPFSRPKADRSLPNYQLNEQYLVWSDFKYNSLPDVNLQAYNLRDHQTRLVAHFLGTSSTFNLKLSGRYLVWQDEALHLTNLDTGKTTLLTDEASYGVAVRGDTLLWTARNTDLQTPNSYMMVGLKQSRLQPVGLFSIINDFPSHWIAGDWVIWKEGNAYKALSVIQAFSNPRTLSAPTPSPADGSRFVQANIRTRVAGAGGSLFWLGVGTATRIYRYNLLTQSKTILYESPEQKFTLRADGRSVIWVEFSVDDRYRIRHYDLTTSQVSTVVQTIASKYNYGIGNTYVAVDSGVLYYTETDPVHKGLWARTLASGEEELISPVGFGPVASDGKLLWVENNPDLGHILHLRTIAAPSSDTVLTNEQYLYVSEYAVGGNNVLWTSRKGNTEDLNQYNISTNTKSIIRANLGASRIILSRLLMRGNTAAWTEEKLGGPEPIWSIKSLNLLTGQISTVLTAEPKNLVESWAMPNERTVAYVRRYYTTSPINDLYIADLP